MADLFQTLPTEIKQVVFTFLSNQSHKESFLGLILVSKSWFAHAIRYLWREVTLRAIWHVRRSRNVAVYLSSIRSLIFGMRDERYHADIIKALGQPQLSNLERISYVPGFTRIPQSIEYIIPYLQPSVLEFRSISGVLSLKFLSALKETCSRLEDLKIKRPHEAITKEMSINQFHRWLEGIPTIRAFSFFNEGHIRDSGDDAIMRMLFSKSTSLKLFRRPFKRLCLEYSVEELDDICHEPICDSLREFAIITNPSVLPDVGNLQRLEKLQIRIDGHCSKESISPLCSLAELKSLKLIYTMTDKLENDEVMSLRHLHKLEELQVRAGGSTLLQITPSFNELDFDQLAASLPSLRRVCLLFHWEPNSSQVLKSAGSHWPAVEYLCLGYQIDLYESFLMSYDQQPLFPHLRRLEKLRYFSPDVTGSSDDDLSRESEMGELGEIIVERVHKIIANIYPALPSLERLDICSEPDGQTIITSLLTQEWLPDGKVWGLKCYRLDWCWEFEDLFERK